MHLTRAFYEIAIDVRNPDLKDEMVYGWKEKMFGELGIHKNRYGTFSVVHLESGYKLCGFEKFSQAKEFIFNIYHLNWALPREVIINNNDFRVTVNRAKEYILGINNKGG